jgi:hypothetical protein
MYSWSTIYDTLPHVISKEVGRALRRSCVLRAGEILAPPVAMKDF